MDSDADYTQKKSLIRKFKIFGIGLLCVFFSYILLCALSLLGLINTGPPKPSPPDLSCCTRIEIQYYPSTLKRIFGSARFQGLVNAEETQYLKSLKTITARDPDLLKALAYDISLGTYERTGNLPISAMPVARVICYNNDKRLTSFTDFITCIHFGNVHWFDYGFDKLSKRSVHIEQFTPQLRPFRLRKSCAYNLVANLYIRLRSYVESEGTYPASPEWCDLIVHAKRVDGRFEESIIMKPFMCPAAGEGKCHYALNPQCESNSPPDTVLLFETKAGWNQHGGPELFTFDNHEPKGGCVLLNDGTVKFIRTKEELQQLRWK